MFANLARIWNEFIRLDSPAGAEVPPEHLVPEGLEQWVKDYVEMMFYKLKTRVWRIGGDARIFRGCVGVLRLAVPQRDPEMHRWLWLLGRLGELTNVGSGRVYGLGKITAVPEVRVAEETGGASGTADDEVDDDDAPLEDVTGDDGYDAILGGQ
jgi:hypothetical protein